MMTDQSAKPILTPAQALSRYHEHLHLHLDGERMGLLPGKLAPFFLMAARAPMAGKRFSTASTVSMRFLVRTCVVGKTRTPASFRSEMPRESKKSVGRFRTHRRNCPLA
ncbi:hypothetical protein [Burkholderia ambifaria]|uniref:hypothetical protein n=1 Tax=Burkholderia ambifaria TaxID=152480 RepID=UPI00158C49BA|nr:hypothetical protein [Burkholderia ambifaria]